ncbi:hypothetical protein NE236_41700 [Actinoallomurus purpureus]|uniref:hypothetical protein n=1 Tax=Actinoallomurus purpureus TaxID=478114 RepID=UPI00209309BB|nr:hypothetical protein [Actinoallomurus purpureus]MCO6011485.1 hypothetical protein [Actinoallomurus purpureus]
MPSSERPADPTSAGERPTSEIDRLLNHSPERPGEEPGEPGDPSQAAPVAMPDGGPEHAGPEERRTTEPSALLKPESYEEVARGITQRVESLEVEPSRAVAPTSPAAHEQQTSHPVGTPGADGAHAAPELTATPHTDVPARVRELADSLRRDAEVLEQRVAAHEAQAREAGEKAEAALRESQDAAGEREIGAPERSAKALAENESALRDQARHTDIAASYRKALDTAREAQIGYEALRNSLEHLAVHEHASKLEAEVSAQTARLLAHDAQKRLASYDDARSKVLSPHPPKYTDYGAIGDATGVNRVEVPADTREAVREWAADLPDYLPEKLRAEIEERVHEILSTADRDVWTDFLQNGIAFESRGHLVWLKPRLESPTYLGPQKGPRDYTVPFGAAGAGAKEAGHAHREVTGGDVEIVENSDAMEMLGLPGVSAGKVSGEAHTAATEVMAGHKPVALKHDFFDWKVRLDAHVDGAELGHGGRLRDTSLTVPMPEQFHREGTPVTGGDRAPLPQHRVPSERAGAVRRHDVFVTAVQPDRLVTEFQRQALQAGMSPRRVAEIVNRELTGHIGQQIMLNRGRDLVHGELTTPNLTVKSQVLRLEHLPESDTPIREAALRDDQGLLASTNDSHQFGTKWRVFAGMKLGMDNPAAKFFARIGLTYQNGKTHFVATSHTALPKSTLVRKAEVARYQALVRMEVDAGFGRFHADIPMEWAVRASDAPQFERDLLGAVRTKELDRSVSGGRSAEATPGELPAGEPAGSHGHEAGKPGEPHGHETGKPGEPQGHESAKPAEPHGYETEKSPEPHGHEPDESAGGREVAVPGAGPVRPAEVAPHEPHPAEPAHLAAGCGAGLGKLTRLPGAERVVEEVHAAIDQAIPDLPRDVRRQLWRDLDARFGRSALEGRSLADVLYGDRHHITVGGRRIEISHHAELGERRGVDSYDMTVNDRKVAGSGTSVGRNTSAGGGVEFAGNMRVKAGKSFGVDFPKATAHAGVNRSKSVTFLSGTTEYRRTETDGPVTEISKEMRHHVRLRIQDGRKEVTDRSWTVDGEDVAAKVVVPEEHRPEWKITADDLPDVGRVDRVDADALPDDRIDFDGKTTAVFPSFVASRDLPLEVGRVEAELTGRQAPADLAEVPAEMFDALGPSQLEAHLAELTSPDGWRVEYTGADGTRRGMTLRMEFGRPEHVASGTGTEIEHYRMASSRIKDGTGIDLRVEAEAKAGGRLSVSQHSGESGGHGGMSGKGIVDAGLSIEADRRTGHSEYVGASDVIRGTYGSGGLTHRFSGSDVHLSVTPDAPAGGRPQTGHLRIKGAADFMMPDRIAKDHHLAPSPEHAESGHASEGPSPEHAAESSPEVAPHTDDGPVVAKPVSEPRTYRPDVAITSAHVERFDGRSVLPEVERVLRDRGVLSGDGGPVRSLLRAAFGEPALAANMAGLRKGVVQWIPVESAYGFTRHIGVRVRAVLENGAHTAERPDVQHMARVQGLSGSDSVHERGVARGAGALARLTGRGEDGSLGGQVGGARVSRSESGRVDGVGEKDIDRRQTREGSQEFTHGIRYEIEVSETKDPPPGLERGVGAIRRAARAFARLTGNDAAARHWDGHRSVWSTTATTAGSVRLVVPDHFTTPLGEGEHVPGWDPVVGEHPRWADRTGPTEATATLRGMVGRISFPGAEVVHEYAPIAAQPPEHRGPVPGQTDRPSGYELSRPRGMELWERTNPRNLLAHVKELLDHQYTLPGLRPGEKVTVGMNVVGLREEAEALLKRREYVQTATGHRDVSGHGKEVSGRGGGSGGPAGDHVALLSRSGGRGSAVAREADSVNIRERNIEVTDNNHVYAADVIFVFHREGAKDLLVDVSEALHIRLTEDAVAELERLHPGLIREPVPELPGE